MPLYPKSSVIPDIKAKGFQKEHKQVIPHIEKSTYKGTFINFRNSSTTQESKSNDAK